MRREPRAVLFDLDDTLYPQRRFTLSGFAVVARHLGARYGVPPAQAYRVLCAAYRRGDRGQELQRCLDCFNLPRTLTSSLVELIRSQRPQLRLPPASFAALEALRPTWRLAIVTNGIPSVQAAKVRALGVQPLVDVVVYAAEHGSGRGKPDAEPFAAALVKLGVSRASAVFVGDNEVCDIQGALAAGLRAVRVQRTVGQPLLTAADAIVGSLREVPAVVAAVLREEWSRDVA